MSSTTQCPSCNTRFKVTLEQIDAHQGLVRCGRCQTVFNASESLLRGQPAAPQPETPATPEKPEPVLIESPVKSTAESLPPTQNELAVEPVVLPLLEQTNKEAKPFITTQNDRGSALLLSNTAIPEEPADTSSSKIASKNSFWLWVTGCLLLLILLMAQATYFFRIEIAARQPGLKPALLSYCNLFQCTVPLPQKAELMSIESSDLEADPAQASVITLNAILRNHASYTQAYPTFELTLNDAQDKPVARRTFRPAEYLKSDDNEIQGLSANREINVKLNLDTSDLRPSGYRLLLFYPQ